MKARYQTLTVREKEICRYLGKNLLNREVAERLSISERTVEGHRASAFKKLGIHSVKELTLIQLELNLSNAE
ncbi:LuxR C-terminal-related transcriptional regulator [uncultured Parasutterella sp.]|uniref:LuxR C-terminal-related transcriptional regulator n=1 Tax=uncultured Parasutterella sp. TaxID=1263098 RepID=UPI0025B68FC2|nr:LuxR C-terminal-related transcriptional regulator [uncultured Parasutterella sp.]